MWGGGKGTGQSQSGVMGINLDTVVSECVQPRWLSYIKLCGHIQTSITTILSPPPPNSIFILLKGSRSSKHHTYRAVAMDCDPVYVGVLQGGVTPIDTIVTAATAGQSFDRCFWSFDR